MSSFCSLGSSPGEMSGPMPSAEFCGAQWLSVRDSYFDLPQQIQDLLRLVSPDSHDRSCQVKFSLTSPGTKTPPGHGHSHMARLRFISRCASCRERPLLDNAILANAESVLIVCLTPGRDYSRVTLVRCFDKRDSEARYLFEARQRNILKNQVLY